MAKAKFIITYEGELDTGELPPEALAEYLTELEAHSPTFNVWEIMGNSMECTAVKVAE